MSEPFGLAAYLALTSFGEAPALPQPWPPRPDGAVIWVWCNSAEDLPVARTITAQFAAEGDGATFLLTFPSAEGLSAAENEILLSLKKPRKLALRSFLDHWMPDLLLWVRGGLDPVVLTETDTLGIERLLVDAKAKAIRPSRGFWIPRLVRPLIAKIDRAFASDEAARAALMRARYPDEKVEVLGPLQDVIPVLPCDDAARADLSEQLATRPTWCVEGLTLDQAPLIAATHKRISRRAHRLLLLAVPSEETEAGELVSAFRNAGFDTLLQGDGQKIGGATQVLVANSAQEPGLWFRLSPITFLCGSLDDRPARHPFEVVSLGSALIHGPKTAPHETAYDQLVEVGASRPIETGDELAVALEELLAPDRSALIATAAWDITSRSAAVTNRVAETMRAALEKAGS